MKYIEIFDDFVKNNQNNVELKNLSNSIINVVNNYFKELDNNLNISNKKDLERLNFILELSFLILEDSIEDNNIELMYVSFYQFEMRIRKKELFNEYFVFKSDNFEVKLNNSKSNFFKKNVNIVL